MNRNLLKHYKQLMDMFNQTKQQLALQYYFYSIFSNDKAEEIIKKCDELDNKMLNNKPTEESIIDKLIYAYIKANVDNSNIFRHKGIDVKSNNKIIELFNRLIDQTEQYQSSTIKNKKDKVFYSLEEHLKYLDDNKIAQIKQSNGKYYIWQNTELKYIIYPIQLNEVVYHGTSIRALNNILNNKTIKWCRSNNYNYLDYHKIFFSKNFNYAQIFGKVWGQDYAILECNLENYNVYNYTPSGLELFTWDDLDISVIEKIYIYKGNKIVKTYNKEDIEKERVLLHE